MWRLGFFFHEIAFGLLSIFVPLYVVSSMIGGSLVDVGIMIALALLLTIPASYFWGYICDKKRQYKLFILLSFISVAVILFLFSVATDVFTFMILYVAMSVFHAAHEAPKNVLIAEHYSRSEWEKSYALYEGLTEIGFLVGLLIGLFTATLSFSASYTLFLCAGLNLIALFLSVFLVADPLMIFERRLVGMEKKLDITHRRIDVACGVLDGHDLRRRKLKDDRFFVFGLGMVLFSLASSMFFTPLPIFFSENLSLPTSLVFLVYMLSSSGSVMGYFFIAKKASSLDSRKQIRYMILLRGFFIILLIAVIQFSFMPTFVAGAILVILGFAFSVYSILMISLSMELVPAGKTGLIDVVVGLGAAGGSFMGPYLAETFTFLHTFAVASAVFLLAFLVLKAFS